ncbi:unnamed protein product [Closterium sp. NIES-54]
MLEAVFFEFRCCSWSILPLLTAGYLQTAVSFARVNGDGPSAILKRSNESSPHLKAVEEAPYDVEVAPAARYEELI